MNDGPSMPVNRVNLQVNQSVTNAGGQRDGLRWPHLPGSGDAMRIVCVGGGPAGLYFALLMKLHERDHDVTVFERNVADSAYGWGVTFGGDLLGKLYDGDHESARQIEEASFGWINQIVDVQGRQAQCAAGGGYTIGRRPLLGILGNRARSLGVHVESGREVTSLSQLPAADLVVACDGVNSRIRAERRSFRTDVRLGANRYIWLGASKAVESFLYSFVRTDSGWLWAYAYGIDADSSTFIVECPPKTWTGLGFDTMSAGDSLSLLERLFERQLDGHRLTMNVQDPGNARWLNFRTITNQRWHDGEIVLIGDAAHTTHYSIGWGTKLAIEDAIVLSESLKRHNSLVAALSSYERQRQAALVQPQNEAHYSALWFENTSRYIDLEPRQFSMLLHGRRSPLLPHLPPRLYCQLLRATDEITVLRELRSWAGPRVKTMYRGRTQPDEQAATAAATDGR
jgi:2-polyprenyl-6-methoxyphenol hydroxylase-like FAD-dependent oxidoreductase